MRDYTKELYERFGGLEINLVKHDTSSCGLPAYIEVHLEKTPKDKGEMVLDLGNYIYRQFGLRYQMTPEYRGRGKKTTLRWFMSWADLEPIRAQICESQGKDSMARIDHYLPYEFSSLIIQSPRRGVCAPEPKEAA